MIMPAADLDVMEDPELTFAANCDALAGVDGMSAESWAQRFCADLPARVDELCELVAALRSELEVRRQRDLLRVKEALARLQEGGKAA
jgi:hypothetical protein